MERRATDLYFEGRISRNEANIGHLQEGYGEVKEKLDGLEDKLDDLETKVDEGFAEIKRYLDRNANQVIGAGKLAKVLWLAFPALCSAIAWLAGRHTA